jgi:hypothetical protein
MGAAEPLVARLGEEGKTAVVGTDGAQRGYRTIRRPGPGLAIIAEPGGRERLWARLRSARLTSICANCGRPATPGYRPSIALPDEQGLRLCAACVVGAGR